MVDLSPGPCLGLYHDALFHRRHRYLPKYEGRWLISCTAPRSSQGRLFGPMPAISGCDNSRSRSCVINSSSSSSSSEMRGGCRPAG
jgi:hypothetical protein